MCATRREVLRSMVELQRTDPARRHATTKTPALFEDRAAESSIPQSVGRGKASHPGPDDRDFHEA
jgi:hypothetical protein